MRKTPDATLRERAAALGLHGLLARWHAIEGELWLAPLIESEETERCRRSLERRIAHAALGAFKPVADFDWTHPRKIDRDAVEALFDLDFLREHINVVFIGSGGVGKTMLAQNLAHRAILAGHTARFVSAADMLGDSANLRRRLRPVPPSPCSGIIWQNSKNEPARAVAASPHARSDAGRGLKS